MPNSSRGLRPGDRRHVVIAGGGFAAVEALLALRALAGDRVSLEIVSPEPCLRYRPSATGEPFDADEVAAFPLAEVAEYAGATFRRDALAAISPADHRARFASGATREYDGLVLALGARRRTGVTGALTFRDGRDAHLVRDVVDALAAGSLSHVAFAVPTGVTWTLPIYELALLTANMLERARVRRTLTVVTPERRPLEVFGPAGVRAVERLLAERRVELVTAAHPRAARRERLELAFGGTLRTDRVVAVPRLVGVRVPGVPGDWNGFVAMHASGRVESLPDVYAAGDLTSYPVKQGGLAAQQADAVAHDIAARVGADVDPPPARRVLRARLAGAAQPLYLRAELDAEGRPLAGAAADDQIPWWPSGKVVGRYLSPYLAAVTAGHENEATKEGV
jgi:sulfide:quinone oxidoreductase